MNNNQPPPEEKQCKEIDTSCICFTQHYKNCNFCLPHQDEGMEWEHEFDLLWGLAPEESLKGKKGKGLKIFIKHVLAKDRIDVARKIAWAAGQAGLSPKDLAKAEDWKKAIAKLKGLPSK